MLLARHSPELIKKGCRRLQNLNTPKTHLLNVITPIHDNTQGYIIQSGVEGNKGVHLAQHCLPYSFPCCFLTPSAIKMIVCTSAPEVTETSLTLHNIKPRHQETLFADDAAVNAHPWDAIQCPIVRFSRAESLASPPVFKRQPSWVKM